MPVPATAAPVQSVSPIDGRQLATLQATDPADVPAAVAEAAEVQRLWAQLRLRDRSRYMVRAAQAVIDEWDELVQVIVAEQGRPLAEAQTMELLPAVETLQWLAEAGPQILSPERVGLARSLQPVKRARLTFEPLGVVAVLTPGAEPFATPLGDVAVALMGGNGVVLHPSPLAALAAERVARVFARAGLPEGLVQIVHGGAATARALVSAPEVAHVRFTGSSVAGRDVGEACARELKRATIEVGGKDPMLVLADANIPRAVAGALWGAFANAGQSGGSLARAYVLSERAERFTAGVVAGASALRVGHPSDPRTEIGPLLAADRVARLVELLDEAVAAGATLHCGGPVSVGELSGAFFAPAVLTGVPRDARLLREDAPGPWIAIESVESENEGIARCNAGVGGLGRVGLDVGPAQGRADRARDPRRHGLDERPPRLARRAAAAVGRRPRLWHRPRARRGRAARDGRAEARHVGPARRADAVVAALRRLARRCLARARPPALDPRQGPRGGLAQRRAPAGTRRAANDARHPAALERPLLEPQRPDLGGALLVVLAAAAVEFEQELELLLRELLELDAEDLKRPPDHLGALARQRRELDEDAAAVVGVAQAARVAGLLEAIDDGGDGGGREPARLGEAPRADRPLAIDDVHAAAIGAVDAERAAGGVVHLVDGGLRRADLPRQRVDELVLGLS